MAYNLCSSPTSSLYQPLFHSLPSSSLKNLNTPSQFQTRLTLQATAHVSTQDPISAKDSTFEHPDTKTPSSSKSNIWVNPRSPRASKLRQKSYDARYSSLLKISEALNSCNSSETDVYEVLSNLGSKILERDAIVVMDNVSDSEVALIALKYFLERLGFNREVVMYNVTLKVCRKSRDLDKAEKLFGEMLERGVKPDNITFSTIISCARLSNLPEKAIEWFEKMPSFGLSPDDVTYSAMIDAYGRAGKVEMALSLYDRARAQRWRVDAVTFSTLIKVYGMSGNFDGCLNVYEEMKALGCKPNSVTYNTLLDAMGRAKRPWQAKRIYKDMIDNGFKPTFATYAALLRAFGRARYGEDAMKVYRVMKEKELELNVILYNTLLAMCADLGLDNEAVEIFNDMRSSGVSPDSWSFSSLITIFSCTGKVSEAENKLNEMLEAGYEPNIFVFTSLIQCYGKAQRTDDVVKTFNRLLELGINPDERFCGCLLNVMTQTPKEELGKLVDCIERSDSKLGHTVKLLVAERSEGFLEEATELFDSIGRDVKKAYCNCLIDLSVNLNLLETACELLQLGLANGIYKDLQSRSPTQWSLHLKSLSVGAGLTALHVWMNDLTKAMESGDELPPLLGINTGHGKHKFSDKGLSSIFESHLKDLSAPFHEATEKAGWFLTTKVAAESWLQSRKLSSSVAS